MKSLMNKNLTLLVPLLLVFSHLSAASSVTASEADISLDERMQWWNDAKFGMFIHWGVYAVPAGTWEPADLTGGGEWIMYGAKIPVADYRQLARDFNPVKFDPDEWASLAQQAGMKYVVITAKHHDGFALYDSQVTEWDVAGATPYRQDLLQPLVAAVKARGLRMGFYYSQAQDWIHPGGAKMRFDEGDGWETCLTMNGSWGYDTHATDWMPPAYFIRSLIDVVSKGGNLLLNVGPKPDGTFPEQAITILKGIGKWLNVHGAAIYGTSASPVGRPRWGRITARPLENGMRLYLHVFDWPADGSLMVPVRNQAQSCHLMSDPGRTFTTASSKQGLTITLEGAAPDPVSSVIVLDIDGDPQAVDLAVRQAADGSLAVAAVDATIHNGNFGKQTLLVRDGSAGYISNWRSPRVQIVWELHIDQPGDFDVMLEAAVPGSDSQITLTVGKDKLTTEVPDTGSYEKFSSTKVGTVTITEAGRHRLEILPVSDGWIPVNLRSIQLLPTASAASQK